jgi:hypothetical protein
LDPVTTEIWLVSFGLIILSILHRTIYSSSVQFITTLISERATETFSEYLEINITSKNLADIKQRVEDKYIYCDSRRKILLKHILEGYEKDCWKYTE